MFSKPEVAPVSLTFTLALTLLILLRMLFMLHKIKILKTSKKSDYGTVKYSTTGVRKIFLTVAASLGLVHSYSREVFQS
jgi:hypothetical protein